MKKAALTFIAAAAALAVFWALPGKAYRLADISTGETPPGFSVQWPGLNFFNAPFAGISFYLQKFSNQPAQALSWLLWLAAAAAAAGIAARKSFKRVVWDIDILWLVFMTGAAFLVFTRQPAPRLVSPADKAVVNFHSHSDFSKDGIAAPLQEILYHRSAGFDVSFITEHNSETSYPHFYEADGSPLMLPGMQANTENISLLLLGARQIPENEIDIRNRSIPDLVKWARARGMAVVCPHWWKWKKPSWEALRAAGVDGFEIYNLNYRQFPDADRSELVKFCGQNGLLAVGSTDWKGFGWACDVWTALDIPKKDVSPDAVIKYLRAHGKTSVLVYGRNEPAGALRYVFEPFIGMYLYFAALGPVELLSWLFWAGIAIAVLSLRRLRQAAAAAAFAFSLFLAAEYSLALAGSWYNAAIAEIVLPLAFLLSIGWLVYLIYEKRVQ